MVLPAKTPIFTPNPGTASALCAHAAECSRQLCDRPKTLSSLQFWFREEEVVEAMLRDCATWMLCPEDVGRLRIVHYKRLLRAVDIQREDRSEQKTLLQRAVLEMTKYEPAASSRFLGALVRQDQLVSRNASCLGGWLHKSLRRLAGLRNTGGTTFRKSCVPGEMFYAIENEGSGLSTVWRSNNRKTPLLQPKTQVNGTCGSKKRGRCPKGVTTRRYPSIPPTSQERSCRAESSQ